MDQNSPQPSPSPPPLRLVEVVVPGLPTSLVYSVPEEIERIDVGYQVSVLARARKATGYVTRTINDPTECGELHKRWKLRPLSSARPAFLPEQLSLFQWLSRYYGYPLAETIDAAIPKFTEGKRRKSSQQGTTPQGRLVGKTPLELTRDQDTAVRTLSAQLDAGSFGTYLLFGVTGSGKTEVYLQLLKKLTAEGAGAIVLVPEIALTPQLVDHFETRLDSEIALLHSELTQKARQEMWERIFRGELKIVLGARSALFAPVQNLKLIIADEEHESSFKQSDSLRYNARDVAVVLAKERKCVALLGSATPAFETLMNVKRGSYKVLELKERANKKPLPEIEVINLAKVKRSEMPSPSISPQLHNALAETFKEGEQAILLYNRRGFAAYLQCETCQQVVLCPNCSVTLTYHRGSDDLLCHFCGLRQPSPKRCHSCHDPRTSQIEDETLAAERGQLGLRGSGTERVVEEMKVLFPDVPLVQMDRDTIESRESYREILTSMREGKAQLLVGTQMIAKGHDLPGVTFVGIIDADVGLSAPDFRAGERAVQLITQAAGRAGRGERAGRVMIQTRQPNHPAIVAAQTGRFMAFARYELDQRKQLFYPPWGRLMRVIVSSPEGNDATRAIQDVARSIESSIPSLLHQLGPETVLRILGPAAAPHEKLRGRFRFHLLVKSNSAKALSTLAQFLLTKRAEYKNWGDIRVAIDIDPVEML